ncbi:DUF7768 domain-containing protein [Spirosoma sordidisoli]|uniref:DUF7768 domain-containing protein n=1 Tax=Spirosoma sordidisoli TaxID=2502893 RepID=UPI0019CFBC3A|nr:hypothetical protein [Spirosoma sordidisoli]
MKRVLVESPYAGNTALNMTYGRACLADCFARGEAPFASHLLYTQPGVLDDAQPGQRAQGIEAGLLWGAMAEASVVYTDFGISPGMKLGIQAAQAAGRPVEYRSLGVSEETHWALACLGWDSAALADRYRLFERTAEGRIRLTWLDDQGEMRSAVSPPGLAAAEAWGQAFSLEEAGAISLQVLAMLNEWKP